MYYLARESSPPKVAQVPIISQLAENSARKGFIEDVQYDLLAQQTTELWLRALLAVAYSYGFRASELLSLKVSQVNLATRTITLYAGETKNKEGRIVTMTGEVHQLIKQSISGKAASDFVFTRADGSPVRDLRRAWWALCQKAGLGKFEKEPDGKECWQGLLFHDLRRSAVRNIIRSGVSERVAMAISGHKTRCVFDRYNIVSEKDVQEAARLMEARQERTATTTATKDTADVAAAHNERGRSKHVQRIQ
jgi:integrase